MGEGPPGDRTTAMDTIEASGVRPALQRDYTDGRQGSSEV